MMTPTLKQLVVALLPLLFAQQALASTWIGCSIPQIIDYVITTFSTGTVTGSGMTALNNCAAYCGGLSTPTSYAYLYPGVTTDNCYCSNQAPTFSYYASAADANGNCNWATQLGIADVSTSFTFNGLCSTDLGPLVKDGSAQTVTSPQACFTQCKSDTYAVIMDSGNQNNPQYSCYCSNSYTASTNSQTCYATSTDTSAMLPSYMSFSHTADASASGLARRKLREARSRVNTIQYCPAGLTACSVQGHAASYECIDTTTELDSCGGCVNGLYGQVNSTSGVDCSAIPGVGMGSTTCIHGQCDVIACLPGWKLEDNHCIRTSNKAKRNSFRLLERGEYSVYK